MPSFLNLLMSLWLVFFPGHPFQLQVRIPGPGGAAPAAADTAFVTNQTLGSLFNNNTPCIGYAVSSFTGSKTVTQLGRWVVSGNSQSHLQTFTDASGTSLGSCTVNTSGQPVGYLYCTLGTPITVATSTGYHVFSQETNGGDQWYYDNALTTTAVATVPNDSYGTGISGANCTGVGSANAGSVGYGPLNFKYH